MRDRIAAGAIEHLGRDQFIVENHIGVLQRAQRPDGEQIGIAGTGADQRHPALGLAIVLCAGKRAGIDNILQRRFGFIVASGENQRADRAIDHALPEAAAQREFGNAAVDRFAPAADEGGEIADARRQHRLDAFAHPARHHRRRSAGAHGDHDIAAIDDRGKDEGRMGEVVHDIYGQADRLGPRRHQGSDVARARAEDCNDAREIGGKRIACRKLDPGRIGGRKIAQIMMAIGRVPANPRARGGQQAQFRPRQIARADEQYGTGLQIEKYRQESHATLAPPTSGVD